MILLVLTSEVLSFNYELKRKTVANGINVYGKLSLLTHTFVASFSLLLTFQIQKNKLKKKILCEKGG